MIEMFVAGSIVLVLAGLVLLALFQAPWWVTMFVVSCGLLLFFKLVELIFSDDGEEGD